MLVNEATQTISLVEIIDRINFELGPEQYGTDKGMLPISMSLVSMWWRSELDQPERGRARVLVRGLDGKDLKEAPPNEYPIDVESNRGFRANLRFNGFPFKGSGIYRIVVQLEVKNKWREVANLPLEIIKGPPQDISHLSP